MPALKVVRAFLAVGVIATATVVGTYRVDAAGITQGTWTSPSNLGIEGVHAALLHTGKVLFYSGTEGEAAGSVARLYDPATNKVKKVSIPYEHPAFCSGVTVLPDGRVMVLGGQVDLMIGHGVKDVSLFDPATETWSRGPDMRFARYYPSVVELPDGRALAVAGTNADGTKETEQLEVYDTATNVWTTLPSSANQTSPSYPRLSLLADGTIARVSELSMTRSFDPTTNTWANVANLRYGKRYAAGHVLLPGLDRVLVAGGEKSAVATNTAEVIDLSAPAPAWKFTGAMNKPRDNLNLVLLADGTVLAVGGGLNSAYGAPMKDAELYNPTTGKWKVMAAQRAQRTYHSTALLLPDGRVISAGSDFGTQATTYEIFKPPYLFKGARPSITSAPATLTYGQSFGILHRTPPTSHGSHWFGPAPPRTPTTSTSGMWT